jgi:radical SAM protein with 4Fe4S-binding SPASM domain
MTYDRRTAKIARYIPLVEGGRGGKPVSLQVALTDRCFNRCIGCGHPQRTSSTMTIDAWLQFLNTLQQQPGAMALESVCYSGGDPFAYPAFNDVMRWHIANGVALGATVTGFLPPFIDLKLLATAAKWVRVSLDAVDPDLYERVRGKTPLFKVIDGIDDMRAAGVHVGLGITLHPDNEAHLPEVLEWAKARGITDIDARYAYPASNPLWKDAELQDRGVMDFNYCSAVFFQLYIDSNGAVYPCCVTAGDTRAAPQGADLGNIFNDPWPAIWTNAVRYSLTPRRHLPDVCRTCCVQRLSEINHTMDNAPQGQSFF